MPPAVTNIEVAGRIPLLRDHVRAGLPHTSLTKEVPMFPGNIGEGYGDMGSGFWIPVGVTWAVAIALLLIYR
ncbi:MAG: hypothetical protein KAV87_56065 [Desulfobacteraceae bacterium]|nr:hypothetical protein [Desulfobacteraceae bacterium]